jgi:predicted DCC family thiol-disulfide oxidoreductase YuxK
MHQSIAPPSPDSPIILFDGVCVLCNQSMQWIARRDTHRTLRFASLQSEIGLRFLASATAAPPPESVVWLDGGQFLVKSDAVLRICRHLGFPWSLCTAAAILPRGVRDRAYDFIARHRYRWFGRHDACPAPPPGLRDRVLN